MNGEWKTNYIRNDESKNSFGIFTTKYDGLEIREVLNLSVSFDETSGKRILFANLYFKNRAPSDGTAHAVCDDAYELARDYFCSPDCNQMLNIYTCSFYVVNRFYTETPVSFGDYVYVTQN